MNELDFVWVLLQTENQEGDSIEGIYATKELAYKKLSNLANKYNQQIFDDCFSIGITTYSIEKYEVNKE